MYRKSKLYLIFIINIFLCACANNQEHVNNPSLKTDNTSLIQSKSKSKDSLRVKNDPEHPEKSIPSYQVRKNKEFLENHYTQKNQGSYSITVMDKNLSKTYSKRYTLKFKSMPAPKAIGWDEEKNGVYGLWFPTYEPLVIDRAGVSVNNQPWKVIITENLQGTFSIEGTNSADKALKTHCNTLMKCFELL